MTSQAGRDLIWAINSPSLIRTSTDYSTGWTSCGETEFDPASVQQFCDPDSQHRVGRYFENLVHFYLEKLCGFEIAERGLQIQEDGRTIGELDFLYRNQDGVLCHCETAVKFFLHTAESNDSGSHFIGPNSADNFERKTRRLFDHQLPLSKSRFPEVSRRDAFVKGRIFYHPQAAVPTEFPDLLSKDHLKGSWIRESEVDLLEASDSATRYRVARKPHWLAPDQANGTEVTLQSTDEIRSLLRIHFSKRRTPQLVNVLSKHADGWYESDRVFVVSDQWPNDAR